MKVKKYWILAVFVLGTFMVACFAHGVPSHRETLSGLKGVRVIVEKIKGKAKEYGLTERMLQTHAELHLRRYGIKVLSKSEGQRQVGSPYLHIHVGISMGEEIASVTIKVQFHQDVLLKRDPTIICLDATTWESVGHGAVWLDDIKKDVLEHLEEHIDFFINDYLAANPKEQAKTKNNK